MTDQKWFKESQLTIISILICLIVLPIVTILLIPVYIIRYIVLLLSRVFKPEFKEMLSGYSTLMAVGDIYTKPTCSGVSELRLDNELDMGEINRIGNIILSTEKTIKARQLLVHWMGFLFWKNNPEFSLKNHLIVHEENFKNDSEIDELKDRLVKAPFSKNKPLWELHFIPNYEIRGLKDKKTLIVLVRTHHALLDWFSFLDLLKDIQKCVPTSQKLKLEIPKVSKPKPKSPSLGKAMTAYLVLKHLFFGPYEFTKGLLTHLTTTVGTFVNKEPLMEYHSQDATIPIETVKHIAKINGVKTAAVTFSAMVGALRQLLIDLEVQPVPETVAICIPIPLPGPRPPGFNNYFSSIPIQAPVGIADPFKRLKRVQKEFDELQYSTKPYGFYLFFQMLGGLINFLAKLFFETPIKSAAATLCPGPSNFDDLVGIKLQNFSCKGGMPFGPIVIFGFYSFSLNGSLYIRVTGDKMLFPSPESSQRFIALVEKEIEILNWDADNGNRTDTAEYNYHD